MSDNSGLKIGVGVSALGLGLGYAAPKAFNKFAALGIKNIRRAISSHNDNTAFFEKLIKQYGFIPTQDGFKELKDSLNKKSYETAKDIFDTRRNLKKVNIVKMVAKFIPVYLAPGAIVDFANRKQRAKSAPNAETKKGNAYTKVNMGKKLGAVLGLAAAGIGAVINRKSNAAIIKTIPNIKTARIKGAILDIAAGFALGALADKMSNHKAAKNADKVQA